MSQEIERKFLCALAPGALDGLVPDTIEQGYLQAGDPEVRIRNKSGRFFVAYKKGKGMVREELEVEVPAPVGEVLMNLAPHGVVRKLRYLMGRYEIDVYQGALEGLVVGEVELESESELLPEKPENILFGRELTEDKRFKNQVLASLGEEEARSFVVAQRSDISPPSRGKFF